MMPAMAGEFFWALLRGALIFSVVGAIQGLVRGEPVAAAMAGGAVVGLCTGALWHWNTLRARRYRRNSTLVDQTLLRPQATPAPVPAVEQPIKRRYRLPARVFVVAVVAFAGFITIASWAPWMPDTSPLVVIGFWCIAVVSGAFLWLTTFTYTEVGTRGVRVRTPTRSQAVAWSELAEVRWHRDDSGDALLLCARDGRQLKVVGATVTNTGFGEQRALRLLADIEKAWSQAG
jgi:hypothetical protein